MDIDWFEKKAHASLNSNFKEYMFSDNKDIEQELVLKILDAIERIKHADSISPKGSESPWPMNYWRGNE